MRILSLGLILLMVSISNLFHLSAEAHGLGKQRLQQVEAGPFLISAWTDPLTNRSEEDLHVTVAVEDNDGLVLEADVDIIATYMKDDDRKINVAATHENSANKLQYEARLNPDKTGTWQIKIIVSNAQGTGQAAFELPIEAKETNIPWVSIGIGIAGIGLIMGALVNYRRFVKSMKTQGRL